MLNINPAEVAEEAAAATRRKRQVRKSAEKSIMRIKENAKELNKSEDADTLSPRHKLQKTGKAESSKTVGVEIVLAEELEEILEFDVDESMTSEGTPPADESFLLPSQAGPCIQMEPAYNQILSMLDKLKEEERKRGMKEMEEELEAERKEKEKLAAEKKALEENNEKQKKTIANGTKNRKQKDEQIVELKKHMEKMQKEHDEEKMKLNTTISSFKVSALGVGEEGGNNPFFNQQHSIKGVVDNLIRSYTGFLMTELKVEYESRFGVASCPMQFSQQSSGGGQSSSPGSYPTFKIELSPGQFSPASSCSVKEMKMLSQFNGPLSVRYNNWSYLLHWVSDTEILQENKDTGAKRKVVVDRGPPPPSQPSSSQQTSPPPPSQQVGVFDKSKWPDVDYKCVTNTMVKLRLGSESFLQSISYPIDCFLNPFKNGVERSFHKGSKELANLATFVCSISSNAKGVVFDPDKCELWMDPCQLKTFFSLLKREVDDKHDPRAINPMDRIYLGWHGTTDFTYEKMKHHPTYMSQSHSKNGMAGYGAYFSLIPEICFEYPQGYGGDNKALLCLGIATRNNFNGRGGAQDIQVQHFHRGTLGSHPTKETKECECVVVRDLTTIYILGKVED